ncbi:MAG: aspartyl protease family protein [Planctomycetaceae bacterium]
MEIATMGKVIVSAKVENMKDLWAAEEGTLSKDQVRTLDLDDALVDTGATILCLPKRYIQQLGLTQVRERTARSVAGVIKLRIFSVVRLTIQDRDIATEVCEIPDDCPPLIGQIPLEGLDFVVDLQGQQLIGNPEHGGEAMIDLFMCEMRGESNAGPRVVSTHGRPSPNPSLRGRGIHDDDDAAAFNLSAHHTFPSFQRGTGEGAKWA